MFLKKQTIRAYILLLVLSGSVTFLKAAYYQPDLFPIGLSGIMLTGSYFCPYYNTPKKWTWQEELQLIDNLGVNCLGSEDCYKGYLIDFSGTTENDYLHRVFTLLDKVQVLAIFGLKS